MRISLVWTTQVLYMSQLPKATSSGYLPYVSRLFDSYSQPSSSLTVAPSCFSTMEPTLVQLTISCGRPCTGQLPGVTRSAVVSCLTEGQDWMPSTALTGQLCTLLSRPVSWSVYVYSSPTIMAALMSSHCQMNLRTASLMMSSIWWTRTDGPWLTWLL